MTEQAIAENAVSLSSIDGKEWTNINGQPVDAAKVEGTVTRVVIGDLRADKKAKHGAELLQEALDHHGETITHLHLWNLKKLDHLEKLPPNLQCLDFRGCSALTRIPDLPETLETLDLDGCKNLTDLPNSKTPKLQYLHLDGCRSLAPAIINMRIGACPRLKEITLSDCTQLHELTNLRELAGVESPLLSKLILKGCNKLKELPNLSAFRRLSHFNLNGCSSLEKLPRLHILEDPDPPRKYNEPVLGLRYLVAHGCDSLRDYRGLDLRPVHLSDHDDDNIIDTLRALEHLGQPPTNLLSSKLLLLGSGRVGKTTLAKALQWADLDEDDRTTDHGKSLNPCLGSPSTHGIQFWPWECEFDLSRFGKDNQTGRVHIWDFAGQEIYHNTHRLFAASGTVFVIVCCDPETHQSRLRAETEGWSRGRREGHEAENRYHQIRYWLDYIRSALNVPMDKAGCLPVVVVHSAEKTQDYGYLFDQAGPYRALLDVEIPIITLDCSNGSFVEDQQFRKLRRQLSFLFGNSADQLGINVPGFYEAAFRLIEEMLRDGEPRPQDAVLQYSEWQSRLQASLSGDFPPLAFECSPLSAVTRYLHRIGQLFWLDRQGHGDVIVDQKLGAQAIYTLCTTQAATIRSNGGLTNEVELARLLARELYADRLDLPRLLRLLQKCEVCVPVGKGHWQALNPALLPDLTPDTQKLINAQWFNLVRKGSGYSNHCFRLSGTKGTCVGAADMQSVLAWVARSILEGEQGRGLPRLLEIGTDSDDHEWAQTPIIWRADWKFWRNGVQIAWHPDFSQEQPHLRIGRKRDFDHTESPKDPFLLRLQYVPFEGDGEDETSYDGSLHIELLTRDEARMSERLKMALFSESSPLAFLRDSHEINDTRPDDHPEQWLAYPRGSAMWPWKRPRNPNAITERHDVAISVRGKDAWIANLLLRCLEAEGISAYYYLEDERLKFENHERVSKISEIYGYLNGAKCLLIVCTGAYFSLRKTGPKKGNIFCPVELAGAVLSISQSEPKRSPDQIVPFLCYTKKEPLDWPLFDELVRDTLKNFKKKVIDRRNGSLSDLAILEQAQVQMALNHLSEFEQACGSDQQQLKVWRDGEEPIEEAIDRMVRRVKEVLFGASNSATG